MLIKKICYWTLILACVAGLRQESAAATLEADFSNPPVTARHDVWWHWM